MTMCARSSAGSGEVVGDKRRSASVDSAALAQSIEPPHQGVRIIPCGACGGDGGHHGFDDVWERCNLCSGEGELEYDVDPVGLDDLRKTHEEAVVTKLAASNVELLIENLVQAAAEYENNCDRLVAKTIRVQLEKAKQAIRDAIIPTPAQTVSMREALEAVQSEIVLTGHLAELVEAALAQPAPVHQEDACAAAAKEYNAEHFPSSAATEGETKTVYVKRWRTLVKLPAKYADEIVAALRVPDEPQPMLACRDCGHALDVAHILSHPRSCNDCCPEFGDPRSPPLSRPDRS